jgi:hypothetical protein
LGFCLVRFGLRPARRPSAERNGGIIHLPTVETVGFDISALPGLRKESPHTIKCGLCGAPGQLNQKRPSPGQHAGRSTRQ